MFKLNPNQLTNTSGLSASSTFYSRNINIDYVQTSNTVRNNFGLLVVLGLTAL